MSDTLFVAVVLIAAMGITLEAHAADAARDFTCFQVGPGYTPELDIASDVAVVYGVDAGFAERAKSWRDHGYAVSMMTGIAWGGYESYYVIGDTFKKAEVQTNKAGRLFMHGDSKTVGYNVPTDAYVEYIKRYIEPAVDAGVQAIYLEEPEYWAETGWSEAFQREWQRFYGEPWQPPDSSPDAQYRASRLKYEMYFNALREVFAHAKRRAADQDRSIECHVPTHSLINYAQWRIVSPESHLSDIDAFDGYVAQVWTGTARSPNIYKGVTKERTFETAFFEYGQMLGMVRPTGKKVWFLADPVEDNPNRSWNDYKRNYECTVIASLMWPEVHRFEVMPWPDRIFKGTYPKLDLDTKSAEREGIPSGYATQILTVINALNEMDQTDIQYDTGSRGVGVIVSDTLMFQRAAPEPSDPMFGCFYGLALPLVKHGIPVEIVQLENTIYAPCLDSCKVLLLTYEGQKPLKPAYHEALDRWVRKGGGLIIVDNGSDPYNGVREWWNDQGKSNRTALDDLFARLGVSEQAHTAPDPIGSGWVRIMPERPSALQRQPDGADKVMQLVAEMLQRRGETLKTQNYLCIRRGPFIVASVLDESVSETPLRLKGLFVDLFDPALPVVTERVLQLGERTLLYDIEWARAHGVTAKVAAAGTRVTRETTGADTFAFTTRGPKGSRANARALLPHAPRAVAAEPAVPIDHQWDAASSTVWLSFDNQAEDSVVRISL